MQLRAFARIKSEGGQGEQELEWQALYLALRCGHLQEAIKVSENSVFIETRT